MTIFWMSGNFVVEWNYCWLKLNKYFCWMKLFLLKLNKYFCWMKLFALKLNKYFCWMKIISCWILQHFANHIRLRGLKKINRRQSKKPPSLRLWLAQCCKIQQLIIFIQQKYLFNFKKINFIQQKYLFNFNKNNLIQ